MTISLTHLLRSQKERRDSLMNHIALGWDIGRGALGKYRRHRYYIAATVIVEAASCSRCYRRCCPCCYCYVAVGSTDLHNERSGGESVKRTRARMKRMFTLKPRHEHFKRRLTSTMCHHQSVTMITMMTMITTTKSTTKTTTTTMNVEADFAPLPRPIRTSIVIKVFILIKVVIRLV